MIILFFIFLIYYRPAGPAIAIRSQTKDSSPDGSYQYSYETDNGISVVESGSPKGSAGPDGPSEVNYQNIYDIKKNHFKLVHYNSQLQR